MAQSFDAASRQTVGEAIPIAENVSSTTSISLAPVTVSETGVLLYQSGGNIFVDQMAWYDRTGKIVEAVVDRTRARVVAPAISPDARSVVFGRFGIAADLWLLGRGTAQRLTTDGSLNGVAVWSRKGDRIAFNSNRDGGVFNLYQRTANVTGHDELLLATANTKGPTQWSRDGRFLIYSENDPKTKWDIWLLPRTMELSENQFPSYAPNPTNSRARSHLTAIGSRTHQMNRVRTRCMCGRFPRRSVNGRFQSRGASNRVGVAMERSCFS